MNLNLILHSVARFYVAVICKTILNYDLTSSIKVANKNIACVDISSDNKVLEISFHPVNLMFVEQSVITAPIPLSELMISSATEVNFLGAVKFFWFCAFYNSYTDQF